MSRCPDEKPRRGQAAGLRSMAEPVAVYGVSVIVVDSHRLTWRQSFMSPSS